MPSFHDLFLKTYEIKPGTRLQKAKCMICHRSVEGGDDLNPYGKDILKAMKELGVKRVTEEVLKKIELLDSLKSGKSNLERIKADELPGKK